MRGKKTRTKQKRKLNLVLHLKNTMITNELQNLGIQNQEIAVLLFVPESTLRTWFKRATTIPLEALG